MISRFIEQVCDWMRGRGDSVVASLVHKVSWWLHSFYFDHMLLEKFMVGSRMYCVCYELELLTT